MSTQPSKVNRKLNPLTGDELATARLVAAKERKQRFKAFLADHKVSDELIESVKDDKQVAKTMNLALASAQKAGCDSAMIPSIVNWFIQLVDSMTNCPHNKRDFDGVDDLVAQTAIDLLLSIEANKSMDAKQVSDAALRCARHFFTILEIQLEERTGGGKGFTTADWKGKVRAIAACVVHALTPFINHKKFLAKSICSKHDGLMPSYGMPAKDFYLVGSYVMEQLRAAVAGVFDGEVVELYRVDTSKWPRGESKGSVSPQLEGTHINPEISMSGEEEEEKAPAVQFSAAAQEAEEEERKEAVSAVAAVAMAENVAFYQASFPAEAAVSSSSAEAKVSAEDEYCMKESGMTKKAYEDLVDRENAYESELEEEAYAAAAAASDAEREPDVEDTNMSEIKVQPVPEQEPVPVLQDTEPVLISLKGRKPRKARKTADDTLVDPLTPKAPLSGSKRKAKAAALSAIHTSPAKRSKRLASKPSK